MQYQPVDSVVREVLNNPKAQSNAAINPPNNERTKVWRGMVVNFISCRSQLKIYETWSATGIPPRDLPIASKPTNPESSWFDYRNLEATGT